MLCLLSKYPRIVPVKRAFVHRLYSSEKKKQPSILQNLMDFLLTFGKKKGKPSISSIETQGKKPVEPPSEKTAQDILECKKMCEISCGESAAIVLPTIPPAIPPKPHRPYECDDLCYVICNKKTHTDPLRNISYCMMSVVAGLTAYLFTINEEHKHHFVPYEYMYKRQKRFAWGEGVKSFFHGPNNFLKTEENYEPKPDQTLEHELERRKQLREEHAKEELERRRQRRNEESSFKIAKKNETGIEIGDGHGNGKDNGNGNAKGKANGNGTGNGNGKGHNKGNGNGK